MRRWVVRLAVLALVLVVVVAVGAWMLRKDPVPVTVFLAARGPVEATVTNSKAGTVKARRRARVSPEIGGRVTTVGVSKGEAVTAGQLLIKIDDTSLRAQAAGAERALDAARGMEEESCLARDQAERDYARAERLAGEQLISEETMDQVRNRRAMARASCGTAQARRRQIESDLAMARDQLRKTEVRAPFDGVVAEVETQTGEWITPSPPGIPMPSVLDLIDTGSIYVSAPLDEVDKEKVAAGQPVRITLDAFPKRSFPGSITRIAPYIESRAEQSRTFEIEVEFDDEAFARSLPPGASADVEVILEARKDALRIPTYALIEGKRVLVLDGCGAGGSEAGAWNRLMKGSSECLVARNVATGLRNWEFVEITDGLEAGERVVVSLDRSEVGPGVRARQTATTER